MYINKEILHFHFCCGLGGGAKGFSRAQPRVGNMKGVFRSIGGVDIDPAAIRDFNRFSGGREGTVMDLFSREQYIAFHGKEPPPEWREVTPADIRNAAGGERPNIVFISSPCKGASGLLREELSLTPKYQALNQLTLRCIWLMTEAWADDPVDLIVFENVKRLETRGRHLLDQINQILQSYNYAVAETSHDCGELGGLAQSRKRFLLVARHTEKVPPFLYEPEKKRLQSVGDVLGRMPLPGDASAGPLHRIPRLQWKTWVRLAFVQAGSDWRSLKDLNVHNGQLKDFLIVPEFFRDYLGVNKWEENCGAISGRGTPTTGAYSVADPRFDSGTYNCGQYGVCGWEETMGAIINVKSPGQGMFAVQDKRLRENVDLHSMMFGIVQSDDKGSVDLSCDTHPLSESRLPAMNEKTVAVIRSLDNTWHRPFTTLELAALQSLVDPEEYLELDGLNDSDWRERIGNAVPPHAAQAIAEVMGTTLLLAWSGETFVLNAMPIWVRPVALGLSLETMQ